MNTLLETPKKTKRTEVEAMTTRVALHPFLAGMNPAQLALLTDCAIPVHFKKGQTILREGDIANRFYLIESGKVVLESGDSLGDPVIVDTISSGDLLGWSWMREYCERDHSLGYDLFKRMTPIMLRRLQAARHKMLGVHRGTTSLESIVLESPFMDQERDSADDY